MSNLNQAFIEKVKKNYPVNADKIISAYKFADEAHAGVKRKSGEPYIVHPLAVAEILMENNMDYASIMAGLLHDVVEDTKYTKDDIKNMFGETVAKLVDGVTKIDNLTYKETNFTEADSIKRLLIAMGHDVRVIFIKLADRLHNMRTIKFLSREKQIKMATETRDLFIPIAERMGIRRIRSELQNLVFKCLYPDDYDKIKQEFDLKFKKRASKIKNIESNLLKVLKENGIDSTIVGWPEHYYSIFKKKNTEGIGKIYGLMLYKIIVPTELDCYKALGILHKEYRHLPSQIKDFISFPKPNGYRSIHSVLVTKDFDITFKVMIRTKEMDDICEYGVSSLWTNKDADVKFSENYEKYNDMKKIVLLEKKVAENSMNFIDAIKRDLSQNTTWAFTPKFKPICLSSDHPTAIDFAYAVHTTIGDNAISAKINGKKASIGAEIHTGDVVEIVLSAEPKAPSRNWLMVATTTNARRKIREYIAKHTTAENVQKGKEMLSAELEKLGYKLGDIVEVYPTIEKDFNFVSLDDMFASVGYKSITIQQLTKYVLENEMMERYAENAPVIVEGAEVFMNVSFPKCCSAIPGDSIVGVMSKNNLAIHTKNCVNVSKIEKSKLLNVMWKDNINQNFNVNIKLNAKDSIGFGSKLLGEISKCGINILKMEAKKYNANDCEFELGLEVKNSKEVENLINVLNSLPDVKNVRRA